MRWMPPVVELDGEELWEESEADWMDFLQDQRSLEPKVERWPGGTPVEGKAGGERLPGEGELARKYEAVLGRIARRTADRYRNLRAAAEDEEPVDEQAVRDSVESALRAQMRKVAVGAAKKQAAKLGVSFKVVQPLVFALVKAQAGRQAERITAGVRDAVARVVARSLKEGWTVPETADRIYAKLSDAKPWQATMLARTDLISLSNGGSYAAAQALGDKAPLYKRWLNADDEKVRPTHVEANMQVVELDQPFKVGDALLLYPGDPAGPDGEVINCRCTLIYTDDPEVLVSAAVNKFDGSMVALYPTEEQARKLSVEGGQDPDRLHVTLVFFPERPDLDVVRPILEGLVAEWAEMEGKVGGLGAFAPGDNGTPVIALPSVPGLTEFRAELVSRLDLAGVPYSKQHGFQPHLTLMYADEVEMPGGKVGLPLSFGAVSYADGEEREDFAFVGSTAASGFDESKVSRWERGVRVSPTGEGGGRFRRKMPDAQRFLDELRDYYYVLSGDHRSRLGAMWSAIADSWGEWTPEQMRSLRELLRGEIEAGYMLSAERAKAMGSLAEQRKQARALLRWADPETHQRLAQWPEAETLRKWLAQFPDHAHILNSWFTMSDASKEQLQAMLKLELSSGELSLRSMRETWDWGREANMPMIGEALQARAEAQALLRYMEGYPERETAKLPKVDPRSQGIPDVYLTERGTFKPGFDAKLKSDLVAAALDKPNLDMRTGLDRSLASFESARAREILMERGWGKYLEAAERAEGVRWREPSPRHLEALAKVQAELGGGLSVRGFHYDKVQEHVLDLSYFPPGLLKKMAGKGGQVFLGVGTVPWLDSLSHLASEHPPGWSGGSTWKSVDGAYDQQYQVAAAGTSKRGYSGSISAHEVGHMVGHLGGVNGSDELQAWRRRLRSQLDNYSNQRGDVGSHELWANGVEMVIREDRIAAEGEEASAVRVGGPFKSGSADEEKQAERQAFGAWVRSTLKAMGE